MDLEGSMWNQYTRKKTKKHYLPYFFYGKKCMMKFQICDTKRLQIMLYKFEVSGFKSFNEIFSLNLDKVKEYNFNREAVENNILKIEQ